MTGRRIGTGPDSYGSRSESSPLKHCEIVRQSEEFESHGSCSAATRSRERDSGLAGREHQQFQHHYVVELRRAIQSLTAAEWQRGFSEGLHSEPVSDVSELCE